MTWPDSIVEQFALVDLSTADASDFHGPYNTLLSTLFPAHEHYQVSPQCKRTPGAPGIRTGSRLYYDSDSMTMEDSTGTKFTFMYVVSKWRVPVFFMQICAHAALENAAARMEADERMRGGFVEFAEFADGRRAGSGGAKPLTLVCAMGTRFAVYELTAGDKQLLPARILPDPRFLVDTAPKARWCYDILDTAGEDKLREVVREVKAMTVDLDP